MKRRTLRRALPWLALAALAGISFALIWLQYRWTGELADAEMRQKYADMKPLSQRVARTFDDALSEACDALRAGGVEALEANWKAQRESGHGPFFSSVALARPAAGGKAGAGLTLSVIDPASGRLLPGGWPAGWSGLRKRLEGMLSGGPPPPADPRGMLLEFPLRRGRPGEESGWLLLQVNGPWVVETWLPDLARRFLNPGGVDVYEVKVETGAGELLYQTPLSSGAWDDDRPWDYTVAFNHAGRTGSNVPGPGPESTEGAWLLSVRRAPGVLDAAVSASRRNNLLVGAVLALLLSVAAGAAMWQARQVRAQSRLQMEFLASISHELCTPLAVIRGAAHNLERGIVRNAGDYAAMMGRHAAQLQDMVEQVLDFSKARRGSPEVHPEPLVTADFLNEVAGGAGEHPALAACRIECDVPGDLPAVMADAAALRRILLNLLHNAAKHGNSGGGEGWIGLAAKADGLWVEISVRDRGQGVPLAEQKSIFEPFRRGGAALAAHVRGSGIGLSLARDLAQAHGGTLTLRSTPGQGATFILRLPAVS